MNRDEFMGKLHPAIAHINAADHMDHKTLEAINIMVDKVMKMSPDEIKNLIFENSIPESVKIAREYINRCEKDIGFMGSPDYDKARKFVTDYWNSRPVEPVVLIALAKPNYLSKDGSIKEGIKVGEHYYAPTDDIEPTAPNKFKTEGDE